MAATEGTDPRQQQDTPEANARDTRLMVEDAKDDDAPFREAAAERREERLN